MRADHQPSTTAPDGEDALSLVRQQLATLQARVDELEAERPATTRRDPEPAAAAPSSPRVGRRQALAGLAGAAAAGTVVALATGTPAAADDGEAILLGFVNDATAPTRVAVTGGSETYGFGVVDATIGDAAQGDAVLGVARGNAFDTAIAGHAVGEGVVAVRGRSEAGMGGFFTSDATDAPAVLAAGLGIGLSAAGVQGQVQLTPETPSPLTVAGSDTTGTLYMQAGQDEESFIDGTLWACVEDGAPGTWRKLAGHDTAGALHILPTPRRVYDSRPGGAPTAVGPKTPLPAGNVARVLDLKAASSGVPAGATGAVVTILLVNATTGNGNFTVWANGQPKPTANTLVWGGDAGRFATQAITAVDPQARVKVDASLQTHIVVDVVGYFR